jgi:thiol:disulfide interchange protein/DsbC/DsbD-like thiol-disulfide interchange protein
MSLTARIKTIAQVFVAALFLLTPAGVHAAPVKSEHMTAELVAQGEAVPGGETYVAFDQKMEPGWHTYWRNSGDAGMPTTIVWTLPNGWKPSDIVWPAPSKLPTGPLMDYGYEGEILLPVALTAPASAKPGQTVTIKAKMNYLICSNVCVPGSADLTLDIKIAAGAPVADPVWGGKIADALAAAPKPGDIKGSATRDASGIKVSMTGDPIKGGDFADAYFFPFDGGVTDYAKPQAIERGPDGLTLTLAPLPAGSGPPRTGPVRGVLSIGPGKAFEVEAADGPPLAGASGLGAPKAVKGNAGVGAAPAAGGLTLPLAIVFAFIGGLILNLMPCVFPILSMKAAALARHAHEPSVARKEGLAFLAGVLATFLVLAGALIAAKAGGAAVGWGFQLQSPPVVAALCLLMLLVALNLSGLFEIGLSAQGAGSGLATQSGLAGAFFTGALAVVVAAPCSAPFMATAIGYALAQPAVLSLLIFAGLGLGFAAPFVAIAFIPGLLSRLPRPGAWMEVFKNILAFPMYGAVAWLAWVFAKQTGDDILIFLFGAAILVAFGAWLFGLGQKSFSMPRKVALQLALPLALIISAVVLGMVAKTKPAETAGSASVQAPGAALPAEAWTPEKLADLRSQKRVVLVDFTAAWCVTCQVNERTSLASKTVADAFAKANAVYMKADWTNRDAVIAKELADHGRAGVPLYLLYPASGGEPKELPQLLTEGMVKQALEEAAKT